jgi:hypothetical protein
VQSRVETGTWGPGVAFWRLRERPLADGRVILQEALAAFRRTRTVESCQRRSRGYGTLAVRLDLGTDGADPAEGPPAFGIHVGGELASTPLGSCIAGALREAMTALRLPERASSASVLATFTGNAPPPLAPPPPASPPPGYTDVPRQAGLSYD